MTATTTNTTDQSIRRIFALQQAHLQELKLTTAAQRIRKLKKLEAYLLDDGNFKALCEAMNADFHKPEAEVFLTEIGVVQSQIRYICRNLRHWMQPKSVSTLLPLAGTGSYILCEPKGQALIISPWNYPVNLAFGPLAYAIAAGNAVIIKPSELAPHTSAFIKKTVQQLFDEKEVAVVEGDVQTAQALLDMPFNHIHFTGSPHVGKIVMAAAAKHLASITLELGGKSPVIIDDTANITSHAAKIAWAKLMNNGQTCIAPDYVLLPTAKLPAFTTAFKKAVNQYYNPNNSGIKTSQDLARMVNVRNFQRVKQLIDDAVSKGATVEMGNSYDEQDRYIEPTLLTGITETMSIMEEEIFGPVLPVLTYDHLDQALAIVNRRPKPLTMYIASSSNRHIDYILKHTSAGTSCINDYNLGFSNTDLPFGGVNNSGIGKSLGYHGFESFSNERSIIRRYLGTLSPLFPPFSKFTLKLGKFFYKLT